VELGQIRYQQTAGPGKLTLKSKTKISDKVCICIVGQANAKVHRIYSHNDWNAITSTVNGPSEISAEKT
jgi:hypothetical protein